MLTPAEREVLVSVGGMDRTYRYGRDKLPTLAVRVRRSDLVRDDLLMTAPGLHYAASTTGLYNANKHDIWTFSFAPHSKRNVSR